MILSTNTGLFDQACTCGNCKYFGEEIEVLNDDFDTVLSGYHKCDSILHGNSTDEKLHLDPGYGALTEDASGYFSMLIVESDFGCVKWEAK